LRLNEETEVCLIGPNLPSHFAKVAVKTAAAPDLQIDIRLRGLEKNILGKGQYRKIKYVLIALATQTFGSLTGYIHLLVLEKLDALVRNIPSTAGDSYWEARELCSLWAMLTNEQFKEVIESIYQPSTIKDWKTMGLQILKQTKISFYNSSPVRIPTRKRGYADKGSTTDRANMERRLALMEQRQEIQAARERILVKQLLAFEQNLDRIISMTSSDISKEEKRRLLIEKRLSYKVDDEREPHLKEE